jgi:hypothetical protein
LDTKRITQHTVLVYLGISMLIVFTVFSCTKSEKDTVPDDLLKRQASVVNHFTIGLEDQGEEYQLGSPIGVRTDSELNIYIADRASMTIKVFDSTGVYIREFGGRGRGPGEFLDMNTFEITPEEDFFVLDRGRWRYTFVDNQGEQISSESFSFEPMGNFFPHDVDFYEDKTIGLDVSATNEVELFPIFERPLFHIYDRTLSKKDTSFFKFKELQEIEINRFTFVMFIGRQGSFVVNKAKDRFYYSPYLYHRNLYVFKKDREHWKLDGVRKLTDFGLKSFTKTTVQENKDLRSKNVSGLVVMRFGFPEPHTGRVNTFDMGLYELSDGRLISFVGKWRDDLSKERDHEFVIDIYAQTYDTESKEVRFLGLVQSVEADMNHFKPLINWKDKEDNFYLLNNNGISIPSVIKFSIEGL